MLLFSIPGESFFQIDNIFFTVLEYPVSHTEFWGTLSGLISVWLASRANILTWPAGIVNEFFLFILFFQVQLYAGIFLQMYFFIVTLYGWYNWHSGAGEKFVSALRARSRLTLLLVVVLFSVGAGFLFRHIHELLPRFFELPAAYPFADSFVMVASMAATVLLARKKWESWVCWIAVDLVAVILYVQQGVYFLALEYLVFLGLASYGLFNWLQQWRHD